MVVTNRGLKSVILPVIGKKAAEARKGKDPKEKPC
jgi:hypothetical protein